MWNPQMSDYSVFHKWRLCFGFCGCGILFLYSIGFLSCAGTTGGEKKHGKNKRKKDFGFSCVQLLYK